MSKNRRRRRRPQLPSSASNIPPPRGSRPPGPPESERISLTDEGFQRLLPVCLPHKAAGRLHTACIEEPDCDLWCAGELQDRNSIKFLTFEPWLAADGRWRLKIKKGREGINTDGSRSFAFDQSARNWEVSAAGIGALRERLIKEQLHAAPVQVELVGTSRVQLVENPTSQARTETPPRRFTAKEWITLKAQRLKRLGEIPVGISKTDFAKMLETNMKEAARMDRSISISPVGWKYISNFLQTWALWPIADIKVADID